MADRSFSVRLAAETAAYEQAMGRAEQATRRIGDAGEKSGSLVGKGLAAGLSAVSKVTATAAAGAGVLGAAVLKTGASYNTLEQQARAALTTILGSEDAANRMMEQVAEFAKTSPFPRQAFIEGTQQLLAFGMEAERIVPTLGAVQDAVAAAGGGAQQISEIVNVLAQVQSSGKFTAETLNQLGYRGVDAAKMLGDAYGISAGEMRDAISENAYDAHELLAVLTEQMTATFGGAAENVKNTWIGATDRIKGAFRDISSIIVEPFISKGGGGLALDWANALADAMRAIERQVGPLSVALTGRLGGSLDSITERLGGLKPAIDGFDLSVILDNLDELVGYAPLVGAVGTALVVMGTNSVPILSTLGLAGINPVVAGLSALVALHPGLRGLLGDFIADLQPLLPALQDTALGLLEAGTAIIDALLPGLSSLLDALAPAAVALGETLGGSAVVAAQALVPVADAVSAVLGILDYIPGSVTTAVLAFAAFRGMNFGGVLTPLRGISEQMALQQTLARNAGIQVGFFGAAMGTASVTAQRLGGALKTAFLSNPVGIALAGLTTIYGAFAASNREAKARVDALTESLDEQTGAITDNTLAVAAQQLNDDGWLRRYEQWGGAVEDLTAAYAGQPEAMERVRGFLGDLNQQQIAAGDYSEQHGTQAMRLLGILDAQVPVMAAATDEAILLAKARGEAAEADREQVAAAANLPGTFHDMAAAMHAFAVEQHEAAGGADRWVTAMDQAILNGEDAAKAYAKMVEEIAASSGAFVSASGALANHVAATKEWAEGQATAFNEAAAAHTEMVREQAQERVEAGEKTQEWADKQVEASEAATRSWEDYYDGFSVNVQEYLAELESMVEAQSNWEQNMVTLATRATDEVIAAFEQMGPEGAVLLQAFLDEGQGAMDRMGDILAEGGAQGTYRYAEAMANVEVFQAVGTRWGEAVMDEVSAKFLAGEVTLQQIVDAYDLAGTIALAGDDEQFREDVGLAIGFAEEQTALPKLGADAGLFLGTLDESLTEANESTGTPDIAGNASGAGLFLATLAESLRKADDSTGTPDIDGDPLLGLRKLRDFVNKVNDAAGVVDVDANLALADESMRSFFRRHDNKVINMGFVPTMQSIAADGGIFERRRANGGVDDAGRYVPRVPMMGGPAYGRTNIRWGEPETGWEAYISGKPGMRQRNIGILEEAARRLGMTVLDGLGTQQFARGGFASPMNATINATLGDTKTWDEAMEGAGRKWFMAPGRNGPIRQMPWQMIWAMTKSIAPEAVMTSNYRPGARTAGYGNQSLHALGRAIDIVSSNMAMTFMKIRQNMPWPNELIHTPMGGLQVRRGGVQTGDFPAITRAQHHDHIHLGYDKGGIVEALLQRPKVADTGFLNLQPGWNPPTYNGLGRVEQMVDAARFAPSRWTEPTAARAPVQVSLDGARITGRLEIGGDGLARLVDGRIQTAGEHHHYESRMVGVN